LKHNNNYHCLGTNNQCEKDTLRLIPTNSGIASCSKIDGVNIRNTSLQKNEVALGENINIECDAVGLNSSVTGMVMFASAHSNTTVEVRTFMEYDTCGVATEMLTTKNATYSFTPEKAGEYNFTFVNIYGDNQEIKVNVK
jgi:cytochrome c oxidase assembly protein Cox11